MKKLLALLLVLAMSASFVACGKTETVEDEPQVNEEVQMEEDVTTEEDVAEETPAETEEDKEESKKPGDKKPEQKPAEKPEQKPEQNSADQSTTGKKPTGIEKPSDAPAEKPVKPADKPAENKTVGAMLVSEFNKNAKSGTPLAVAEAIVGGGSLPFMAGAMEVEPGLLAGFDNYEVKGFKSGAVFQPMIGSIAFIGYVFEVEDGVSASDFAQNLKKNANMRWNICVEAEEMVTSVSGNKVFFVMCPKAFEE